MSMSAAVRDEVARKRPGQIFLTRHLLHLGTRTVVDKVTSKLVKLGVIIRLARGVFMIPDPYAKKKPSKLEIALAKAKGWGKDVHLAYNDALIRFRRREPDPEGLTICTTAASSSFKSIDGPIYFQHVAPRKLALGGSELGTVTRTVWHQATNKVRDEQPDPKLIDVVSKDRMLLKRLTGFMPAWLTDGFVEI